MNKTRRQLTNCQYKDKKYTHGIRGCFGSFLLLVRLGLGALSRLDRGIPERDVHDGPDDAAPRCLRRAYLFLRRRKHPKVKVVVPSRIERRLVR